MKVKLGPKNCLYPMPTTLIGALVNGKPNYVTIAHYKEQKRTGLQAGKLHSERFTE